MTNQPSVTISKVDAAHRQLRTAITLWFTESDPVSTHALVFAAYEVLHTVSKKRTPSRRDLLFDSDRIKDEYRSDFNKLIKKHAYFFKHADREPEGIIEFNPNVNEMFIFFCYCCPLLLQHSRKPRRISVSLVASDCSSQVQYGIGTNRN
jgi:hypothetical protein